MELERLKNMWKKRILNYDVKRLRGDVFFIIFRREEDCKRVLKNQSRLFKTYHILLRKWEADLKYSDMSFKFLNICVRILDLPVEYMSRAYVKKLALQIGTLVPLEEDDAKDRKSLEWDMHLCVKVKINITTPLVKLVKRVRKDNGENWHIVRYENLPILCFLCGSVGHVVEACGFKERKDPIDDLAEKLACHSTTKSGILKDYGR
ncbi:PREDICTED: uncharacterized protein LOC104613200 [Nelumbo nucifera]|uniref:Uncharacterized protein LOC104613200 n=1 Tax=Nelumbo nucifera TaxID=4432 RepID=A0A1U8BP30_NELNU|nr:PREDICTED: uncharacterized protein LOC104613200 [Nelumbo nucifera]